MAERVVLHIGLMKSGTSFLQRVLRQNRKGLRRQGILYPSPWRRQVDAVKDVTGGGLRGQPKLAADGPWRSLVAEVAEWPGTAVVSMEFLAPRGVAKARQIIADLAPAEVEVVVTVRDLARSIPAMWQESVQNRSTWTWAEYVAGVEAEDRSRPGPGRAFWTRQDAPEIVEAWQKAAGPDQVTVVTVPPPGAPHDLLWQRFASIVPVESEGLDLDVRSNPSLGLASLEVLRRLNLRVDAQTPPMSPRHYERIVKQLLAKRGLAGRDGDPRLGHQAAWVVEKGDRDLERLAALGARVVGDLEELRCAPVPGAQPEDLSVEDHLEAALDAVEYAVTQLARRTVKDRDRRNSAR
ncbi:hypothetical protein [Nocardioides coralli]|uniref:hypothetical protein n=1 Tax=Nocardioides coralli TaxID=2872154 RepID=UPI001CA3AA2C|nr:hypothetical protein [Nocardioides coralli]QZY30046.1 hypothetical protein K6T13_05005 [Nocardioides coralli]